MRIMMQRLNQVKYACTKEQQEALKRKGFREVPSVQKEGSGKTLEPEKEPAEEKPRGRRAKGEKDG